MRYLLEPASSMSRMMIDQSMLGGSTAGCGAREGWRWRFMVVKSRRLPLIAQWLGGAVCG